jgi:hypothetical protein
MDLYWWRFERGEIPFGGVGLVIKRQIKIRNDKQVIKTNRIDLETVDCKEKN